MSQQNETKQQTETKQQQGAETSQGQPPAETPQQPETSQQAPQKPLHIAIAAGGTAGHVNPALALAEELTQRGHKVSFYGQPNRLEAKLVPEAGYDFVALRLTGFDRSRPWTLPIALWNMYKAQKYLQQYFSEHQAPDAAVGFGAYVELPLVRWCHANNVPYLLHEQNSVIGLANKISARQAARICVAFPAAQQAFAHILGEKTNDAVESDAGVESTANVESSASSSVPVTSTASSCIVLTGNPVRKSVINATRDEARKKLDIPADAQLLAVVGGSLGAQHVNATIATLKDAILGSKNLYVIHSTGAADFDKTVEALQLTDEEKKRYRLLPYIANMGDVLAAADLIISRAGASSIAEISALCVPAILVPYPFATADHQTTNAQRLVDCGAALLFPDDQLDFPLFAQELFSLLHNEKRLADMRHAAASLRSSSAAAQLADEVESVYKAH